MFDNWLVKDGFQVPDLDPKHPGKTITFHPQVRFVGLISPVGQMGTLNLLTIKIDPGWKTSLPSGVASAFVARDNSPGRLFYPETNMDITRAAEHSEQQFDFNHENIGYSQEVMTDMLDRATLAGVPIKWDIPNP